MRRLSVLLSLCLALSAISLAQNKTYIALGDSVGWGYQPGSTSRGNGDKGYVKPYADWLATQQGGTRPTVINLSIPGESTGSFFDTSEIGGFLNSNYPILFRQSQSFTFRSKAAAERNAGRTITHVTVALGANDLLDLQDDSFFALPHSQQTAIVDATLFSAEGRLVSILNLVRQECPTALVKIPGYYNPYGAFPSSPENLIGQYAIPRLNAVLITLAKHFRATFVPVYTDFLGQELALTWIGEDDIHPRNPGYTLYAQKIIGSKLLLGVGPRR
ncbi:MAG TPA: SGNH/GDSL hydrolase family protein [Fimbriimonadaceae bacterium]|nr:SGNH/GDSL hydrolase family protein [Fimbriimonadaceae bacterium]